MGTYLYYLIFDIFYQVDFVSFFELLSSLFSKVRLILLTLRVDPAVLFRVTVR